MARREDIETARYADMLAALGAEPRLRIMRLLLAAHPEGMFAGQLQQDLAMAASTLSHHLEKLKNEGLVKIHREGTFLRYTADADSLRALVAFLYQECCTRNRVLSAKSIFECTKKEG